MALSARDIPVVDPSQPLIEVLEAILDSRVRATVLVKDGDILGVVTISSVAKALASRIRHGVEPLDALEELKIGELPVYKPPVYESEVQPLKALHDMLLTDVHFAIVRRGENIHTFSILDALFEIRHMVRGHSVREVTSGQVWWSIPKGTPALKAFMYLSALPSWRATIIDEKRNIIGVFSAADFLRELLRGRKQVYNEPVENLVARRPLSIDIDAPLETAIAVLSSRGLYTLPVIDPEIGFAGMLYSTDIARLIIMKELISLEKRG